jgi:two-component system phosphate regulon response regulator PhoB
VLSLLVIDDDLDLLTLLSTRYNARGYSVASAATSEHGLMLAAEHRPDVVLLDFCLPRMDGTRFIEQLRADEKTRRTPVVVMSAASIRWVSARLPQDPLIGVLEKPFEFPTLDALMNGLVNAASRA